MMLRDWLHRVAHALRPASTPEMVMGTRPGFVWDEQDARWVDEDETWKPGRRTYAMVGPVYAPTHGHP